MSATAISLIFYILWTLLLLVTLLGYRSLMVVKGQKEANQFRTDGTDLSDFAQRLTRCHANCIESFPWVAGPMLVAMVLKMQHLTDFLAYVVIGARILQSIVHLCSTSVFAVQVRFATFVIQVGICSYWLVMMLMAIIR